MCKLVELPIRALAVRSIHVQIGDDLWDVDDGIHNSEHDSEDSNAESYYANSYPEDEEGSSENGSRHRDPDTAASFDRSQGSGSDGADTDPGDYDDSNDQRSRGGDASDEDW